MKEEKSLLAHRLIAETFVPNSNNYLFVNHKDGDRSNNKAENLEWVSEGGDQFLFSHLDLSEVKPSDLTNLDTGFDFED